MQDANKTDVGLPVFSEREIGDSIEVKSSIEELTGVYSSLGELPPETLITEDGLARSLGRNCRETVKRAVDRGELPRPVRLMGKNTWTVRVIIRHIENRLQKEAERHASIHP